MVINLPNRPFDGSYSVETVFYWFPKILEFKDLATGRKLVWLEFVELEWIHRYNGQKLGKELSSYRIITFKQYWQNLQSKNKNTTTNE